MIPADFIFGLHLLAAIIRVQVFSLGNSRSIGLYRPAPTIFATVDFLELGPAELVH